ncbi:MAG: hypothetical protein SGJ23_05275 [Alphaproteobacteria bacterium]|nr:hypothetical protein [Alphaproteobacteria bacterium]
MSLNKSLNRLFDEIRRETKRNPEFADRLDAIFRVHESAREVPDEVVQAARVDDETPAPIVPVETPQASASRQELNPVAFFTREGADALKVALTGFTKPALEHLVSEHNLDPAGATAGLPKPALVEHIIAQAQKRVERDRKLFDY